MITQQAQIDDNRKQWAGGPGWDGQALQVRSPGQGLPCVDPTPRAAEPWEKEKQDAAL